MDRETWRIESQLRGRIQELESEMYSRTAKLESDLNRLSHQTDGRIWDSGMRICYVYLVLFTALAWLFIVMLHLYANVLANSPHLPAGTSPGVAQALPAGSRAR